jgi:hypothetical protein
MLLPGLLGSRRDRNLMTEMPGRFRTMRSLAADGMWTAVGAFERGIPFERRLTIEERLAFCLVQSEPTHLLTIHSRDLSYGEMGRMLIRFLNRVERSKSSPSRLVYFGSIARSESGMGGHHAHLLLWEFLWAPMVHRHARELRLGKPRLSQLPCGRESLHEAMQMVTYVLAQQQQVFGSSHHERHTDRLKHKRRFRYPQRETLRKHLPELFTALQLAYSSSTSDMELRQHLPMFSN